MTLLPPQFCDRSDRTYEFADQNADNSPNRLMVDESPSDDNSVAILHPNTMETLGLFR
jgi:transitional endoplasmic reticulum ATPase